jgi:hypothetical protein
MRVVIEHRQVVTGLGGKISQFVDCTVQFSEEEKAIIKKRGLGDHIIVLDPPTPPPAYREYMTAGILQGFAPLFAIIGFGLIGYSLFLVLQAIGTGRSMTGGVPGLGILLLFGSPIGWAVGFLMDRSMDIRFTHPKQHISVRSMLAGPFTVFSPDPAYSDLVVDQIKERLTYLKLVISGSARPRQRQTYEL